MAETILGIIGGSGVYDMDGLEDKVWRRIESPWGAPSDELLFGTYLGQQLVFLPRHGRGHSLTPTDINYRANIDVMKRAGVTDILSVSACGSFREQMPPGTFVIVDQFVDRTHLRPKSFFGPGLVAHVSMAQPVCQRLGDAAEQAAKQANISCHRGGTYLAMEGPQFSSHAESTLYRNWGMDVIGMTNMPEAKLAREAEMDYATIAMVTDFDCWHPDHGAVDVDSVITILGQNAANAQALVKAIVPLLKDRPDACPHGCDRALDHAVITAAAARDKAMIEKLGSVAGRVLS
ncbi:MAG: S-methyl-5'-thioadenosine phosphorylase [Alphaproteobacteria bacterium]